MSSTVQLHDVGHKFAASGWLFRNLTLTFTRGSSYALTGPSGSGKSTFLAIVAGWIQPVEGSVEGLPAARNGPLREKSSWVFQNAVGLPRRTALDHVVMPLLASGHSRQSAEVHAFKLLDAFKLADVAEQPFRALSGGEAQRLMLARAVAADSPLLLVDEPTAQLDAQTSDIVNDVLRALTAQTRIVLVATHDPGTMEACDEVVDLTRYQNRG